MALQFPTRVLVALDGSEASRHALTTACELCRATGSELHLVYVATTSPAVRGRPLTPAQREAAEQEGEQVLEAGRTQANGEAVEVVQTTSAPAYRSTRASKRHGKNSMRVYWSSGHIAQARSPGG